MIKIIVHMIRLNSWGIGGLPSIRERWNHGQGTWKILGMVLGQWNKGKEHGRRDKAK